MSYRGPAVFYDISRASAAPPVPICGSAHPWVLICGELTLVKGRSSDVMRNKREEVWCILPKPAAEVTGAGVSEEVLA